MNIKNSEIIYNIFHMHVSTVGVRYHDNVIL